MRPWLQDKDGDGVYAWATTKIPAGDYTFKVAHDLSWDENYGDGGVLNGPTWASPFPPPAPRWPSSTTPRRTARR